ncbi:MAG TPA: FAD-dependent oxidoreductase [Thermoleophilia bacterium]|nr:FAD-dependent oxidoreductase [Acidobacteriota bacterium]HQF53187.1 FAD-dependent oxidoreductase [Thermoleophilia bacterium]HQH21823.1 FAD-dependent oxidoreductase [Thermoleophilia bacterium]HQJ27098.1 FAD-dependent oxidoreductase [Thermoleophilia bacterium]
MARVQMYSMEWCPYCAKAKALLNAKGIEYDEVDVTDDEAKALEMVQRTGQQGVPQFFIDGRWIGGYDNLAYLNATGALDQLFGIESTVDLTKVWDVAVVGAGPAGLTAALYAARKNLSTILIALDLGGQVGITHLVTNYPGLPVIEGPELVRMMFEQAYMYGLERMLGERVQNIRVDGRAKVLELVSGKEVKARAVIVASGAEKRRLEIPGESEFAGRGVVYCSTCDGPFYRDKTIAIVGGGNSALEAAVEMSGIAKKVYVVSRREWSADEVLKDKAGSAKQVKALVGYEPLEIVGSEMVEQLTLRNLKTGKTRKLKVDGVFIEVGLSPNSDLVLDLVSTNQRGEVVVDEMGDTGVRGVFAAGDVTATKDKQIVIAAGEGAKAALAAFDYLITQR